MNDEKIILWGLGKHCLRVLGTHMIPLDKIEMVIDSDASKKHPVDFPGGVHAPADLCKATSDMVVIGSRKYYDNIAKTVNTISPNKKIVYIDDYAKAFPVSDSTTAAYFAQCPTKHLIAQMDEIDELPEQALQGARLFANRTEMLSTLPLGGDVAEIGVAYGWFSDEIITRLKPDHFYAIDYFNKENPFISMWGYNYFAESGLAHEEWYRNKYKHLIDKGTMTVCSGLSWDEMDKFPDDFFDYIYIDGGHDYSSVKKDIAACLRKIKPNGYLQFNDYTLQDISGNFGSCYGVVPAVNEMIIETGSKIIGLALQKHGYYDLLVKANKQ